MTLREDCLCATILYSNAFKQITVLRYCSYAASLAYITQYVWYTNEDWATIY